MCTAENLRLIDLENSFLICKMTTMRLVASFLALAGCVLASPINDERLESSHSFDVFHSAQDYFPHAARDVRSWNIDATYSGYNLMERAWLQSVDPSQGKTDEEKGKLLLSVSYGKRFDPSDQDMVAELQGLMGAVSGHETPSERDVDIERRDSLFLPRLSNTVKWAACTTFFSACMSGTGNVCRLSVKVHNAPRSTCENVGGSNCCLSWSSYDVKIGFFQIAWDNCNREVHERNWPEASCRAVSDSQGGSVCMSNRATGCEGAKPSIPADRGF